MHFIINHWKDCDHPITLDENGLGIERASDSPNHQTRPMVHSLALHLDSTISIRIWTAKISGVEEPVANDDDDDDANIHGFANIHGRGGTCRACVDAVR